MTLIVLALAAGETAPAMSFSDLVSLVRDVGLPSVIALFVLWKLNGSLGSLRDSVLNLTKTLIKHQETEERSIDEIRRALDRLELLDRLKPRGVPDGP